MLSLSGNRNRFIALGVALLLAAAPIGAGAAELTHEFGQVVDYPLVFPVGGAATAGDRSGFWDARATGIHQAQDILAPKLTPVYAVAAGTIAYVNFSRNPAYLNPERCCTLVVDHDDGWESWYLHLNNDTPGSDDGLGWGIADGLVPGSRVQAGQLIGWVGDSGNAEDTAPHLHFELRDPAGVAVDAYQSLLAAEGARSTCLPPGITPLGSLLSSTQLLRLGSYGPAVYELQGFLTLRGFRPGPIDGTFSQATHRAVRAFQERRGLAVDGVVGPETRGAILAASLRPRFATLAADDDRVLKRGDRAPRVQELKQWLRAAGYDPGRITRLYSAATAAAVRAFQEDTTDLPADGQADAATRLALARAIHLIWPGDCP